MGAYIGVPIFLETTKKNNPNTENKGLASDPVQSGRGPKSRHPASWVEATWVKGFGFTLRAEKVI